MKFHDSEVFEKFENMDAIGAIQTLGTSPNLIG